MIGWLVLTGCGLFSETLGPPGPSPIVVGPATDTAEREGDGRDERNDERHEDEGDDNGRRRRPAGQFQPVPDPCAGFGEGGLFTFPFQHEGKPTESLLFVPSGPGPFDLVVVLHGGSGNPAKVLAQTRLDEAAGRPPVVLAPAAAPVGDHGPHWNSGNHPEAERAGRDDVAFLDQLTAAVSVQVCVQRILAAGFSNGGQMAMRWGCQGRQPDAVLTTAGRLLVPPASCARRPVRGYVGTKDPVYDDTPQVGPEQRSVVASFEAWARINACDAPIERPSADARCRVWQGCRQPTELCIVPDLHHAWPSPWNRKKPTETDATAEGLAWFRDVVPARRGRGRPP